MATAEVQDTSAPLVSAGGTRDGDLVNDDVRRLQLTNVVGYSGDVLRGLYVHPDADHMIYPVGCSLIIEDLETHEQNILAGHTNFITAVTMSKSGELIASGQMTHMGFKADIIVWHYPTKTRYATFTLHRVHIQSLAFSPSDKYLASLGGKDDASVVVWDLEKKDAVCGSPAAMRSAGQARVVAYCCDDDERFLTGGDGTLRVWKLDLPNRKIHPQDINMGQMKRNVECIQVLEGDKFAICGTTTGDILKINLETALLSKHGPTKNRFSQGIKCLSVLRSGDILLGAGDGTVCVFQFDKLARLKTLKLAEGGVNAVAIRGVGHQMYIGSTHSQTYFTDYLDFKPTLLRTCQPSAITDVSFAAGCSDLFVTSAKNDIRVWNTYTGQELLRISVPNMVCNSIAVQEDGKAIISGWNDGKIRAFFPESGKPMWTIEDAHNKGVTALCATKDSRRVVSGGGEGQVRVWNITKTYQRMADAMKEHKGPITMIKVRKDGSECVSASVDGSCIIWDLGRFVRNQVIFASTLFQNVCYHPTECQIIATGTDKKIGYWETFDGSAIREIEASVGSVNALDISLDGMFLVSGGEDRLVKLWRYMEGRVTHIGVGHSATISRIKICPNTRFIVSVSQDGAIMRWDFPNDFAPPLSPTMPGDLKRSQDVNAEEE
ncbi:cilia- and flagella-associated protein 52-like [Sycon ciliatum]|uniref:cilia- and flagella-associated protein 52-like n=1 Tax=Sycon ciliatum TaxID=27933 RepID=UPI0020AE77D3|eukprot:scpid37738/ scgid27006/ WD repeat-containing protein 16; WD40-repeat protein up-regulated in HCC